jgi:hypothetical protein
MKRVGLSYVVKEEDIGNTIAFKIGWLWWQRYVPVYIAPIDIGLSGKKLLRHAYRKN